MARTGCLQTAGPRSLAWGARRVTLARRSGCAGSGCAGVAGGWAWFASNGRFGSADLRGACRESEAMADVPDVCHEVVGRPEALPAHTEVRELPVTGTFEIPVAWLGCEYLVGHELAHAL